MRSYDKPKVHTMKIKPRFKMGFAIFSAVAFLLMGYAPAISPNEAHIEVTRPFQTPVTGTHTLNISAEKEIMWARGRSTSTLDSYWWRQPSAGYGSVNAQSANTMTTGTASAAIFGSGYSSAKYFNIRSGISFNISTLPYDCMINNLRIDAHFDGLQAVNSSYIVPFYVTAQMSPMMSWVNYPAYPTEFFTDDYYNGMNYSEAINNLYLPQFYNSLAAPGSQIFSVEPYIHYPPGITGEMTYHVWEQTPRFTDITTNAIGKGYYNKHNWTENSAYVIRSGGVYEDAIGNKVQQMGTSYPTDSFIMNLGWYGKSGTGIGATGFHKHFYLNQTAVNMTQYMSYLSVDYLHLQMLFVSFYDMYNWTPTGNLGEYNANAMTIQINYTGGFLRGGFAEFFAEHPSNDWLWTEFDSWFFGIMWLLGLVIMIFTPVIAIKNYGGEGDRLMGSVYSIFMFGLGFGLFWAGLVLSNMV